MIAIDTNVLLRYLLDDDEVQSKKAAAIISRSKRVLVTDVVLVETTWTLKGKKYKLDKERIIQVINALFREPNIFFESDQAVWRAMKDYRYADPVKAGGKRKEADFPDTLIVNKARLHARKATEQLVLLQCDNDVSVSHQAVRCGFIFMRNSGSLASKYKAADDRLMAHPKGANQRVQLCVVAVRHRTTMASQRRLDLNALVCADTSLSH